MSKRKSDDNKEDNIAPGAKSPRVEDFNPVMAPPDSWGDVLTDYLTHIRNTINSPLVVMSLQSLDRLSSATNNLVGAIEQRRRGMSLPTLAPSPALIQSKLE